jgi:hypothetical protein
MQFSSTQSNASNNLNNPIEGTFSQFGFLNTPLESSTTLNPRLEGRSSFDIQSKGETEVAFSSDLTNALSSLNVQVEGFGNTRINRGVADFRIIGGAADIETGKVDIIHNGGLTFKTGDVTVNLTDFIISNLGDSPVITGAVTVNNDLVTRAPLFDLQIGQVETSEKRGRVNLDLEDVRLTLTGDAANVLNQAFDVNAFTSGFNIGTADVDTKLAPVFNTQISDFTFDPNSIANPPDSSLNLQEAPFDIRRGGETSLAFSNDLVNALTSLQVQAKAFGNTSIQSNGIAFPITGGIADVDSAKVDIIHDGGLTLSNANTTVDLTDFIITNLGDRAVITGDVTVNDDLVTRATLFDLQVGSLSTSNSARHPILNIDNVQATLTNDAANVLNQAFGVSAFTQGLNIGTADVEAPLR